MYSNEIAILIKSSIIMLVFVVTVLVQRKHRHSGIYWPFLKVAFKSKKYGWAMDSSAESRWLGLQISNLWNKYANLVRKCMIFVGTHCSTQYLWQFFYHFDFMYKSILVPWNFNNYSSRLSFWCNFAIYEGWNLSFKKKTKN